MKLLVLGAGLQGGAAAWNLLQHEDVELVTIADHRQSPLPDFLERRRDARLRQVQLDANDFPALVNAMAEHDAALNALPYYFNEAVTRAAIESGCHACDLGGNTDIVFAQKSLGKEAESRGVSVIPDCGLAPGMVNILAAEGIRRLDRTRCHRGITVSRHRQFVTGRRLVVFHHWRLLVLLKRPLTGPCRQSFRTDEYGREHWRGYFSDTHAMAGPPLELDRLARICGDHCVDRGTTMAPHKPRGWTDKRQC